MRNFHLKIVFLLVFVLFTIGAPFADAMVPTLNVSAYDNNSVSLNVYGDSNSSVYLYYNLSSGSQSAYLGTTNNYGYFSTTLNGNNYGITSGALVYVIVNNQQSTSYPWPNTYNQNYYSSGINISTLNLPVGGSAVLNTTSGQNIYVNSNSNSSVVSTGFGNNMLSVGCKYGDRFNYLNGQPCYQYNNNYVYNYNNTSSLQINALTTGTAVLNLCTNNNYNYNYGYNANCTNLTVYVTGSSPIYNQGSVLGACYFNTRLTYGMSGSDVTCLQNTLLGLGYLQSGYANSYFDNTTLNAVIAFQSAHSLYPDGIVGRNTRNQLFGYRY